MLRLRPTLLLLFAGAGCVVSPGAPPPACTRAHECGGARCVEGRCQTTGCGDGRREDPEACDEGADNGASGHLCSEACALRACGDGIVDVELGERCDGAGCAIDCLGPPRCGDGETRDGEACDDANDRPGDGCEQDCKCSPAVAVQALWQTVLVRREDGALFAFGELPADPPPAGVDPAPGVPTPTRLLLPAGAQAVEASAGAALVAVRTAAGEALLLGGGFGEEWRVLPGPYVGVSAGVDHVLLLDAEGAVSAIGHGDAGQAGVGTLEPWLATPQPVIGLPPIELVLAVRYSSLAIDREGGVWAWGASSLGETGVLATQVPTPRRVSERLTGCDQLRSSGPTSFARCGGRWWGWGWDHHGQLSTVTGAASMSCLDGTLCNPEPTELGPLPFELAELAVGQNAVYALDAVGGVWGWGNGPLAEDSRDWDALGLGGAAFDVTTPTRLALPVEGAFGAIAGGFRVGFALHPTRGLFSAGDDGGGALGRAWAFQTGLTFREAGRLCGE